MYWLIVLSIISFSIVFPLHGQANSTIHSLKNILENTKEDYAYEVMLWPFTHRGSNNIGIKPSKNGAPFEIVKAIGTLYTKTHKCYYLENTPKNLDRIFAAFKDKAWVDFSQLKQHKLTQLLKSKRSVPRTALNKDTNTDLQKFKKFMVAKSFSPSTVNTYLNLVVTFLGYFAQKQPNEISNDEVDAYLHGQVVGSDYSQIYQRQVISAL